MYTSPFNPFHFLHDKFLVYKLLQKWLQILRSTNLCILIPHYMYMSDKSLLKIKVKPCCRTLLITKNLYALLNYCKCSNKSLALIQISPRIDTYILLNMVPSIFTKCPNLLSWVPDPKVTSSYPRFGFFNFILYIFCLAKKYRHTGSYLNIYGNLFIYMKHNLVLHDKNW